MPLAPFATRPSATRDSARGARRAVLLAVLGIAAALLAYAISPGVRHAVRRAAHSVTHVVGHVFHNRDRRAAPTLPHEILSGRPVTLTTLRGHPALVMFWSSRCAPCARQAHAVRAFAREPQARGRLVGVAFADSAGSAQSFLRRHHWTFANLRDPTGSVGRRFGLVGARELPVTYVLNSTGHIVATLHGAMTEPRLAGALRTGGR